MGYSFRLTARVLLYAPSHRQDSTYHTFVTPVVEHWLEWEIAHWVHPMKDRSHNPSHHERMLLPWSYISLLKKGDDDLAKYETCHQCDILSCFSTDLQNKVMTIWPSTRPATNVIFCLASPQIYKTRWWRFGQVLDLPPMWYFVLLLPRSTKQGDDDLAKY